jgi:hypothetical protein
MDGSLPSLTKTYTIRTNEAIPITNGMVCPTEDMVFTPRMLFHLIVSSTAATLMHATAVCSTVLMRRRTMTRGLPIGAVPLLLD